MVRAARLQHAGDMGDRGTGSRNLKRLILRNRATEQAMDDLIANFGLYALAACGAGFVLAWIACARADR